MKLFRFLPVVFLAIMTMIVTSGQGCPAGDSDGDSVKNRVDNCVDIANPDQEDADNDDFGDACDICEDVADDQTNTDGDDWGDACDNCPKESNNSQADDDDDEVGNVCDNCPNEANPDGQEADKDCDGAGDACDLVDNRPICDEARPCAEGIECVEGRCACE